jgi:hypothetical protein
MNKTIIKKTRQYCYHYTNFREVKTNEVSTYQVSSQLPTIPEKQCVGLRMHVLKAYTRPLISSKEKKRRRGRGEGKRKGWRQRRREEGRKGREGNEGRKEDRQEGRKTGRQEGRQAGGKEKE